MLLGDWSSVCVAAVKAAASIKLPCDKQALMLYSRLLIQGHSIF